MSPRPHRLTRFWALPMLTAPVLLVRCSGTEADNPVADVVVTACKTEREYDPTQVETFLNQRRETQAAGLASLAELKSTENPMSPALLHQPLTRTEEFPIGLHCVEWQLVGNSLEVQIVNYDANCGAAFRARATREGDRVTLLLDDTQCTAKNCGTCLYDTATVLELPSISDVRLELSADPGCTGERDIRDWQLPLAEQPRGMICDYARPQGLARTDELYAWCGREDKSCDDGLTCADDGALGHCVPACSDDADCPFPSGTRCNAGYCIPAAAIP
jgi:hypothetical protein